MSADIVKSLAILAFGVVLCLHCPRAAWREFKAGVGHGRHGDYPRDTMPIRFWGTIVGTAAAGMLGIVLMTFSVATLIARWNSGL